MENYKARVEQILSPDSYDTDENNGFRSEESTEQGTQFVNCLAMLFMKMFRNT